ncbi:MAG: endonuclease III [Deltaproteobacteria bacterium]|nr:MAG: endonuclease III [Deltaproteobacteria bacterium]
MTRAEKAERIQKILQQMYELPAIPLRHEDPYTLLIAVVLSAQCTDRRVNEVTPRLFARAATPDEMVALSVPQIRAIIRPCGLAPSKARNIRALSKILIESHGGRVPRSMEALEALPGVGHKTASVVMAQAFGEATFPVDTHIHRLAARWGLSNGTSVARTERDLKRVFPRAEWNRLHLQIIYFGRGYCPARGHDADACPICSWAAPKARLARERRRARGATGSRGPRSGRLRDR